ncbi:Metal-dependent hydrolase, composite domain [Syntrophomonas zehnderi OL-4]|uniref:Metal-dependent hydrolase, composite domain n=1 Tax=Syntrophomonas zehnderi OL-4 TaxID=690567 RepID=A0A0E4C983_9FIRM|nr:amidohydrolase [Syntrophomonas zehnderi]CFX90209.1 Metal-dependent hydrolase, composite domain [Syntrophomonas zehnderi OL-4]
MYAIKGGKIITMDEAGIIEGGIILIEGALIKLVSQEAEIPDGYTVIEAGGKYITPGFIDSHTHLGLEEEIYRVEGDDVNETSDPITPQLQAVDGINFMDLGFKDALRGGVTRAMAMPGSANILGGQAVFLKTLAENLSGMIYKNPWGLKAALGENPKRVYTAQKKTPQTRMASASLLREALYTAARNLEKTELGAQEEYRQSAIFKVLRREMPLLMHVHRADDILTALRIKDEFNIDLLIQHGTEAVLVADELVKRNVPVFLGPLLVNRAKVEMKEVAFKNARLLAERGVEFSFITDHPVIPIEHLRVSAALSVRAGLDEDLALQAITSRPAKFLGVDGELGSIRAGKWADLVIFDGHPFDFRSSVEYVMVDGKLWRDQIE